MQLNIGKRSLHHKPWFTAMTEEQLDVEAASVEGQAKRNPCPGSGREDAGRRLARNGMNGLRLLSMTMEKNPQQRRNTF